MTDNITGIVLDIPPTVLENIKDADKAIQSLEKTSKHVANTIKGHFDNTMVSGVNAFIRKVQEAQSKLGDLKMPTIDPTGLSSAVQALSQAMGAIDKSATTGSNRLGRIADAMAKLQATNPDPQLFQNVADGITKIGNTSQQTIDNVKNLAAVMAQLARDIRTVQNAQNAQSANTATAAQYNKLYKEQAQLMREIQTIQNKKSPTAQELALLDKMKDRYAEIAAQITELNKKQQSAATFLARAQGQMRVGFTTNVSSPQGAINYAKNAKSLNDLQAAYKNLKAVMATTKPNTTEWNQMNAVLTQTRTRIDEIKKNMGEFKSTAQGVGDIAGQMKRTLAAVFSVSAITGYINKMIEVRAQFELQQTALRAILQDKQKADQVFQQVQQLALQSPFSIMQMTTFTKQLAAYRIEADKLVGTTKMLADVSAGLGVDMGRLILAFGQVKSANYLRATEVRQFTEAGLNITGELANYFSELQGKMVSVGDVTEMITKRMVRFEDVEEVFKRVTSAGGLFYDMQRKQSETLWGQLQRIKDAISIMFNEIGKDNQGAISNILNLVRSLINHWRMLAPIISTVGAAMATVLAVKGIQAFITSLRTMGTAVATLALKWRGVESAAAAAAVAERGATMATGIGLAVTVVTALAGALLGAYQEAQALNEELGRISEESSKDMWDLTFKYRELAGVVRDSTKSYNERKEALEELQNTFRGILPDYMTEVEYIKKISDGYAEATNAIQAYSIAKLQEQRKEAIDKAYGEKIEEKILSLADTMAPLIAAETGATEEAAKGAVANIWRVINERIKSGDLNKSEAEEEFKRQLQNVFNISLEPTTLGKAEKAWMVHVREAMSDLMDVYDEIAEKYGENTKVGLPGITLKSEQFEKDAKPAIEQYKNLEKAVSDYTAALEALYNRKTELEKQGGTFGQIGIADVNGEKTFTFPGADADTQGYMDVVYEKLALLQSQVSAYGESFVFNSKDINAAMQSNADMTEYFATVGQNAFQNILNHFGKWGKELSDNPVMTNFVENATSNLNLLTDSQKQIITIARKVAAANGISMKSFDLLKISAATNYTEAAEEAKKLSDAAADNIKKITATRLELINLGWAAKAAQRIAEFMWGGGKKEEDIIKEQKAYEQLWKALGGYEKESKKKAQKPKPRGSKEDAELKRWKDIQKAIEDANKSYEKYRRVFSSDESNQKVKSQYGKIFKELGVEMETFYNNGIYDATQLAAALRVLQGIVKQTTPERKRYGSELSRGIEKVEVEIDIKNEEDEIKKFKQGLDDIFNNYELSKTFADLGVNINVVYALGGKPTKLSDIREQLNKLKAEIGGKEGAEEQYKAIEDAEKRLAKMEQKYAEERAKNYIKYLTESLAERAQIEVKAQQDINKIREDATLDAFSKEQAINNRRKQMNEDLAKFDFDNFKASDVYISVFEDLEHASKTQLQYVIDKLREFQSTYKDLSPAQVKSIAKSINDAEKALGNKSIFLNFKAVFEYQRQRNALKAQQVALQEQMLLLEGQEAEQAKKLYDAELALKSIKDTNSDEYKTQSKEVEGQRVNLTAIQGSLRRLLVILQNITGQIQKGEDDTDGLLQTWNDFAKTLQAISSALSDVQEGLENMGSGSAAMSDGISTAQEVIGGVMSAGEGVLQAYTDPSPWGKMQGAVKAVGGAIKAVGALFAIGDKKKERQIQRLQEKIERLQTAYEKLGKAMEDAYTFDKYNADYEKAMQNLLAQRKAVQEQLALEESKKKSDKNKIKEYEKTLDELIEKEKELREARYEAMGSVGNSGILSEAENFVSAWLDAYKETGDGLDALKEHWDEFFENLVLKQASSAVVSKRMKKYVDQINAAIDSGDTGLSLSQTFAQIGQNLKNELGTWNEDLKAFFDAVGIKSGQGELLLSDLQKGIQNITEPQAAAIEAYLNSMRFAVFEQNNILTNMLTAIQAQYGANDNNTMLNEVKAIRTLVSSIDDRLSRVIISRNSSNSGYIMKVG